MIILFTMQSAMELLRQFWQIPWKGRFASMEINVLIVSLNTII